MKHVFGIPQNIIKAIGLNPELDAVQSVTIKYINDDFCMVEARFAPLKDGLEAVTKYYALQEITVEHTAA